ncbi:protein TolA, partial [Kineococcus sp. T90]|nr:protein TolA [Kineococcus indalonis]
GPAARPPPAGAEAAQPDPEPDLSGPTYAEKVEEQRRARRAAEERAREEEDRGRQG